MFTTTTMFQGNLAADPKLRYTNGGTPVAEFRVLVSHRVKNNAEEWVDAEPTGHNVKVYGRLAEATVDQLPRAARSSSSAAPKPTPGPTPTPARSAPPPA